MRSIAACLALLAAAGAGSVATAAGGTAVASDRVGVPAVLVDYDDLNIYGRIYVGPRDDDYYEVAPEEGRYYYRDEGRYYYVPPERRYYRFEYDDDHDRYGWYSRNYRYDIDDDDLEDWLEKRYDVDVDVDDGKIKVKIDD